VVAWAKRCGEVAFLADRDEMERKQTELSGTIFVFIFLCRSGNEYRNTGNTYKNRYF
jgi:hypothetical protein